MFARVLMSVCGINMGLAIYMGFFIPLELHKNFAFTSKDYFVVSFVGFCFGLLHYLRQDEV